MRSWALARSARVFHLLIDMFVGEKLVPRIRGRLRMRPSKTFGKSLDRSEQNGWGRRAVSRLGLVLTEYRRLPYFEPEIPEGIWRSFKLSGCNLRDKKECPTRGEACCLEVATFSARGNPLYKLRSRYGWMGTSNLQLVSSSIC